VIEQVAAKLGQIAFGKGRAVDLLLSPAHISNLYN
jgi:hypothetical protein